MNESRKLYFLLVLVRLTIFLSICGCVYQLWDITNEYFAKQVVTEIKIRTSNELTLPAISLCTRLPYLVNFTRLDSKHPEIVDLIRTNYSFVNSSKSYAQFMETENGYGFVFALLASKFTLEQILNLLFTWNDLIAAVDIVSNKGFGLLSKVELQKNCDVSVYSMELNACFRFDCSKNGGYVITNNDMKRSKFRDELVSFSIRQDVFTLIPHLNIYLHAAKTYPNGQNSPTIIVRSKNYGTLNYFSYKRYETDLLPPPYTSNCRDYTKDGFYSRNDAIATCENELSLELLNAPFYGNCHSMEMNATHGYFHYFLDYQKEKVQQFVNLLQSHCGDQYIQPNCKEEFFVPKETTPRPWKGQHTLIVLNWPTDPDIIVVTKEKLPFSEFIILIESVVGTWFGFCFAGSLPIVYRWALRVQKGHYEEVNKRFKMVNIVRHRKKSSLEITVY